MRLRMHNKNENISFYYLMIINSVYGSQADKTGENL